MGESSERRPFLGAAVPPEAGLGPLVRYFLKLGALGFGGPAALVGYMHRDLVERYGWVKEDDYRLALALAQIMPGPLAAQTAIALGYFQAGVTGATLVGLAFVLPSFFMVIGLAMLYVAYGGLWWMQALFYGIGAAVIAIIAIAAYRLARSSNRRDPLLWAIFGALLVVTVGTQAELAEVFILAGLVAMLVRAWPGWIAATLMTVAAALLGLVIGFLETNVLGGGAGAGTDNILLQLLFFFTKAGAFVFGSGLAIVPFLQHGVVQQFGWLTEHQFLDAVAVAMITPGPVVITVAFIGYLVAGWAGASLAAVGIFLPVYVFTIIPAPWFKRHRENAQLRGFVAGTTAAATGAIAGAVVVLGQRAIFDPPTAAIALVSLGLLLRFRLQEPLLVALAGLAGLALWPLVQRGA
ncbi:MAG: chromate efflux transporter [Chloroflexi bacterium]|nr:chromate efflux transporter [Chloroflexota bacterium]